MNVNYLKIQNPGVADYRGLTLLGVSTTRNSGYADTVGCFGSGSKNSIALLLRHGIYPVIICGNLKMEFSVKEQTVKGQTFRQVVVKYSGKDIDGNTKNSTEELGFTLEWGVQDWDKLHMAFREFVSNAIDGSIISGGSYKSVVFERTDNVRAKSGTTQVYIPETEETLKVFNSLSTMFLHFDQSELLNKVCLPKRFPGTTNVLIYKKGVLVANVTGDSIFDYNLPDLTLDESRNANEWDVKYAVSKALRDESSENIATIIKGLVADGQKWEGKLDSTYMGNNSYSDSNLQEKRKKVFADAWASVAGPKGVATSSSGIALQSFVIQKGFTPVVVPAFLETVLESYDVATESKVLSKSEKDGKKIEPASAEMIQCTDKVWKMLESFGLTKNKNCPEVKGFTDVMDGGSLTLGYYIPGEACIYLNNTLGTGKLMFSTALEEIVHYVTGSGDFSRDIQDFLFNLITEMSY